MISAEAPVLFAKACEMFILELTLRCARACTRSELRPDASPQRVVLLGKEQAADAAEGGHPDSDQADRDL